MRAKDVIPLYSDGTGDDRVSNAAEPTKNKTESGRTYPQVRARALQRRPVERAVPGRENHLCPLPGLG